MLVAVALWVAVAGPLAADLELRAADFTPACRVWVPAAATPPAEVGPVLHGTPGGYTVALDPNGRLRASSEGAIAGAFLRSIAERGDLGVSIVSPRERAAVWAVIDGASATDALRAVALSVGLVPLREGQNQWTLVDANDSDFALRRAAAERETALPLTTRSIPTAHASFAARAMAMLVLGCRGRAVALPADGVLLVDEMRDSLDTIERVVRAIDARGPRVVVEIGGRDAAGVHGNAPTCPAAGIIDQRTTAALMKTLRARGASSVAGCIPSLTLGGTPSDLHVQRALGLAALPASEKQGEPSTPFAAPHGIAVLTPAPLHAVLVDADARWRARERVRVVVFASRHAEELARAANFLLGDGAAVGDNEAGSAVVRVNNDDELAQVDAIAQTQSKKR